MSDLGKASGRVLAVPLPEPHDWVRKLKSSRTLNDLVEDIHNELMLTNAEYREYLEAVYDSEAITGSLTLDDGFAAKLIRDRARVLGSSVQSRNEHTISKALHVVMERYGLSRRQRRRTVDGRITPGTNGDDA
jgi:hypothetical protein